MYFFHIFMRLPLDRLILDLAFHFQVSKGTVSNILSAGISIIARKLAGFFHTLSKVFKKAIFSCRVIMDCT